MPVISEASNSTPYRAVVEAHSLSMYSFRSRRFLRRSLIDTPITSVACDADPAGGAGAEGSAAAGVSIGLASKFAILCRRTETKETLTGANGRWIPKHQA